MSIYSGVSPRYVLSSKLTPTVLKPYQPYASPAPTKVAFVLPEAAHPLFCGRTDNEALPSAKDIPALDPQTIYAKLQTSIDTYKATLPENLEKLASHFRTENHPALYQPEVLAEQKFHRRTPDLNEIPFFFAETGTEIAKADDIQLLPPGEKEAASIRLIAKRFIDSKTNKSIFTNSNLGKASPTLQMQERPIREIRAQAATATASRYSGQYIYNLYQHIFDVNKELITAIQKEGKDKLPLTVYVIRPGRDKYARDCSTNFLTVATHTEVTDSLNFLAKLNGKSNLIQFSDRKQLTGIGRSARTTATPIGRIALQGYYNKSEIKPGDQVVIVDDHCQAGGTILGMSAAVKEAGGKVIAAVSPTAHPLGLHMTHPHRANFMMSAQVKEQLENTLEKWDPEGHVQKKLNEYGIPVSTLTNHEAMIIIAYATDPSDVEAMKTFEALEKSLHVGGKQVLEGANDSLKPVLNQKPLSAKDVALKMEMEVNANRKTTKPMKIQQVHVFDYDDCLTDEQGVLYKLMHNALQTAAQNYGQQGKLANQYPFLDHLAEALNRQRGHYQTGMPLLCMDKDQYADVVIQSNLEKQKVSKKEPTLTDLWAKLEALDPALKAEFDALGAKLPSEGVPEPGRRHESLNSGSALGKTKLTGQQVAIDNILWSEFKRQYQQMLRPALPSDQEIQSLPLAPEQIREYQQTIQRMRSRQQEHQNVPFPDVKPTFMQGAQELLEKLRRPENLIVLLSNKADSDLNKEINTMGWAHYFDVISGKPNQLVKENGQYVSAKRQSKPNSYRLEQLTDEYHNLEGASWTLWGNSVTDGTQVLPLIDKGKIPADKVTWMMINPSSRLKEQAQQSLSVKPDLYEKIKIIASETIRKMFLPSLIN